MHSEGHLLEGAHELGGADHHRLLLAANNVVMQSHAEGPASQISDQSSNEDEHLVASGDDVLAEALVTQMSTGQLPVQLPFGVRRDAVEHRRAVDDEEGGTSAEVARVVIGKWQHLAHGLEANEGRRLSVQVAVHGEPEFHQAVCLGRAERVPEGGFHPADGVFGGLQLAAEFRLKTGRQRLHVVGHSSRLQLVEVFFAAVMVHSEWPSRSANRSEVNSEQVVAALALRVDVLVC